MPAPDVVHLRVGQGETLARTFTASQDVDGWVGRGQIRSRPASLTVLYDWPASGITCAGATVTVTVPADVTALWTWQVASFQIEAVDPDGDTVLRVVRGAIVVAPWAISPPDGPPTGPLYPSTALYPQGA